MSMSMSMSMSCVFACIYNNLRNFSRLRTSVTMITAPSIIYSRIGCRSTCSNLIRLQPRLQYTHPLAAAIALVTSAAVYPYHSRRRYQLRGGPASQQEWVGEKLTSPSPSNRLLQLLPFYYSPILPTSLCSVILSLPVYCHVC